MHHGTRLRRHLEVSPVARGIALMALIALASGPAAQASAPKPVPPDFFDQHDDTAARDSRTEQAVAPSGVVRRSLPHREDPFATLQGKVIDADNGEPVERANIRLNDNQRWTLTDENGMFAFENLGAGAFEIEVTRIGYHRAVLEPVVIRSGESAEVEIELDPDPIRLSEVTVTPGQFSFLDGGANPAQTLSRDEIESVPQIADDVFRAVNRLPGLASGDYSAHFGIRGGRHDETLILLDGLEIYEPYHLKDFDEGAISIIDGETVDGVDLLTGGFSPKYGNRRSGVLRIRSRRVEDDQTRALGGLSFVNARGLAMGRLPNGGGQWMASARSGYLDLILGFVKAHDLPSPSYHDLFGKLELDLHPRHTLLVDALHAGDRYEFNATATTGYLDSLETRESATNRYGNSYLWSTWTAHWTDRAFSRTRASVGLVTRARDGFESYLDRSDPLYSVREDRDLLVLGIAQDWTLDPGERWSIELGFDLRGLQGKQTLSTVVGQDPNDPAGDPDGIYPYRVDAAFDKSGTTFASYASQRWRPFDRMVVDAGVRYDHADYTRDRDWSPRTGLALQIGSANTLRLGWGHYRQMQRIDDVSVLDPDQSYFASELSSQWTVGLEHAFPDDSHLRIEAYDKRGSDLRPQYRNWKGGVDTFPESNEDRIRVYPSASRAQGLEIYYDRQFRKHLQVRASYAFSHAEETVSRIDNINVPYVLRFDAIHDAPMDQRHALNLDCSVPLSERWLLSGAGVFHSGWPTTHESLVPVVDSSGATDFAILPVRLYAARLPDYYRIDLRVTRRWPAWGGEMRAFGEVVNLTNHANVFGYDYYRQPDGSGSIRLQRDSETWFSVLPSLGIAWSRRF